MFDEDNFPDRGGYRRAILEGIKARGGIFDGDAHELVYEELRKHL
jgi:hypothetical protein